MKAFGRVLTMFGILLVSFRADAHDASMQHHEWFNKQEMNPAAQRRLGVPWKSCCDNGDVFKTRFRVVVSIQLSKSLVTVPNCRSLLPFSFGKEKNTFFFLPYLKISKYGW